MDSNSSVLSKSGSKIDRLESAKKKKNCPRFPAEGYIQRVVF